MKKGAARRPFRLCMIFANGEIVQTQNGGTP